jgi:hypothetical protein
LGSFCQISPNAAPAGTVDLRPVAAAQLALKTLWFFVWLRFANLPLPRSLSTFIWPDVNLEPAPRVRSFFHDPLSPSLIAEHLRGAVSSRSNS